MKTRYLVIGIFIVLLGITLYFTDVGNLRYTKTLKFKEFSVNYNQYLHGSRKFSEGHYLSNDLLYAQANRELALKLCEHYRTNKDVDVKEKIIEIATKFSEVKEKHIDSILKYDDDIFNTNIGIE